MFVEPTMDITYPVVTINNPNNQNIVFISDDTSSSVRVPLRPLNWKQRARGSTVEVEDKMQDVEIEQTSLLRRKWDGKLTEDLHMDSNKKLRLG
ncbi:hypothetical protein Syun_016479 [Stephania yunnanensis]|uniref:Uncharacterized protein n=1 Tax=Stephania yunnanensis TaxID=152371 RepID=A0AAP0J7I9_9MAGN